MYQKINITHIDDNDITLTYLIDNCGTNKTKYRDEIIYLFRKYIDPSMYFCNGCGTEMGKNYQKYKKYFDIYISSQTIENQSDKK